ncbi:MAG TPA: PA14 domain-containing protein [Vicinamibacteria bacterium]|nr:PA14 domain-containing protein [Vicinamibacteria bacterium]
MLFGICAATAGARAFGLQGVRIGPIVPELSLGWVVAPAVLAPFFWRVARPRRAVILGITLALTALALSLPVWLGVVARETPQKAVSVYDLSRPDAGPVRRTGLDSLRVVDRANLHRIAGRRGRVALDITGYLMVPESGSYRFEARCDDGCSLQIDGRIVLDGTGSAELDLEAALHRFRLRYEQRRGPAVLELQWDRPGTVELLPIDHYVSDDLSLLTATALRERKLTSLLEILSSALLWPGVFCLLLGAGHRAVRRALDAGKVLMKPAARDIGIALQSTGLLESAEPNLPKTETRATTKAVLLTAILNVPFVLFHPDRALVELGLLRSLAVNLVLFLAPGLPVAVAFFGRRANGLWLPWGLTFSLSLFVAIVSLFFLAGVPLTSGTAWNATWILTNVGLVAVTLSRRLGSWSPRFDRRTWTLAGSSFLGSYLLFFFGAERVVPPQSDHDFEVQGTGYGLLTRLEPFLLTDRETFYYFAHPLLLHIYVAGSFLYFDEMDHLAYYDAASRRALAAERGEPFEPPATLGDRRIVEVLDSDYVVDPPLTNGRDRIPVTSLEMRMIYQHYADAPHTLATRSPNVFLAAVTVSLLVLWVSRIAPTWVALLAGMAYATSPEVTVRSSYGGYFAISNFLVLLTLLSLEKFIRRPERYSYATCFLTACLAALANHKLILLPMAVGLWQVVRTPKLWRSNVLRASLNPVVLGFGFGTAVYWAYGMAIDFDAFWLEHVRTHLMDRLVHHNPLGYTGYPGPVALWIELWKHTAYLLLPIGILALVLGTWEAIERGETDSLMGLFLFWTVITAAVFTSVDWRMTKHLMPLMLPLHLAPILWAGSRIGRLRLVGLLFSVIVVWNWTAFHGLIVDFHAFRVTPEW